MSIRKASQIAIILLLVLVLIPGVGIAEQSGGKKKKKKTETADLDLQPAYEAGQYTDVVEAVRKAREDSGVTIAPADLFLTGLSYEGLDDESGARVAYGELAQGTEDDAWRYIGESAAALVEERVGDAAAAAQHGVEIDGSIPEGHYQLGMVRAHQNDYTGAASELARAVDLKPDFAYAHYYAGLSFYRLREISPMVNHFEAFLRLAPDAPERPQVESILRTVRG